jgi:hypothetical protein
MSKLTSLWRQTTHWLGGNPERHLDQAFRSAASVKEIEDQYFGGKKISAQNSDYGAGALAYFNAEVNRHLQTIERQLSAYSRALAPGEPPPSSLEKLDLIDAILQRYAPPYQTTAPRNLGGSLESKNGGPHSPLRVASRHQAFRQIRQEDALQKIDTASNKTGVLPRSFLRTVDRLRENMNPQSDEGERKVLNQYRNSRYKTALSVKFLLMLVIIPLLVHQLTKTFFLTPLVESYFEQHAEIIFINQNMEAEAYEELQKFEYSLHFRGLLGFNDPLMPEQINEKMREKASEISENFRRVGTNAIANIFADLFSLIAFIYVLFTSRKEIQVLKEFIDEIVYGLSDSAKAFLIILFTDVFVGFHSPHGWEVVLKSIAQHFGLPENQDFNFLFIATFPVVLDTVFKYWIFRYLNGISPSAVATYRNMNE